MERRHQCLQWTALCYVHTHTHTDQLTGSWSSIVRTPFFLEGRFPQAACFFWTTLLSVPHLNMRLQGQGVLSHFGRQDAECFNWCYINRWISRGGSHASSPRSPYFTSLDFCIWTSMKTLIYTTSETTDTRWTSMAHHGRCCCSTDRSWKHMETNTCCFRTNSLVRNQHGKSFKKARLF